MEVSRSHMTWTHPLIQVSQVTSIEMRGIIRSKWQRFEALVLVCSIRNSNRHPTIDWWSSSIHGSSLPQCWLLNFQNLTRVVVSIRDFRGCLLVSELDFLIVQYWYRVHFKSTDFSLVCIWFHFCNSWILSISSDNMVIVCATVAYGVATWIFLGFSPTVCRFSPKPTLHIEYDIAWRLIIKNCPWIRYNI